MSKGLYLFGTAAFVGNMFVAMAVTQFGFWPAVLAATALDIFLYVILKNV